MFSLIADAGELGISKEALSEKIALEFRLTGEESKDICQKSIFSLLHDSAVVASKDCIFVRNDFSPSNKYQSSIDVLVDGAINRFCVRESGRDEKKYRDIYDGLFKYMILERGWDLGAAFSSGGFGDQPNCGSFIGVIKTGANFSDSELRRLGSAADNMLLSPTKEQAAILVSLGRLAFALELVYQSPLSVIGGGDLLPQNVYLDANIILPMLVSGHPYNGAYMDAVLALLKHKDSAGVALSIYVYDGFLNEVISHKSRALSEYRSLGVRAFQDVIREVTMFGSQNVNVFFGAFAASKAVDERADFEAFVRDVFPFSDEAAIGRYVSKKFGIKVLSRDKMIGSAAVFDGINTGLQKEYSGALAYRGKAAIVISHDATQLTRLYCDLRDGLRSVFFTADKTLRVAAEAGKFSLVSVGMMSHVGLVQLVDFAVRPVSEARSFSKLLWGGYISSNTEKIRDYFTNIALREHNAALTKNISEIIEGATEDVAFALEGRKINLNSDNPKVVREAMAILGEHEERFYKGMKDVLSKLENE